MLVSSKLLQKEASQSLASISLSWLRFNSCSKLTRGVDRPPFHPSRSTDSAGSVLAVLCSSAASRFKPNSVCCLAEVLAFSLVANTSIASLNLSLLVNSVGFYQASPGNMTMQSNEHWAASTMSGEHHKHLRQRELPSSSFSGFVTACSSALFAATRGAKPCVEPALC